MRLEPFTPHSLTRFWCNKCDANVVDSEKPETGSFFVQFGHTYDRSTQDYSGEYTGVMFALCPECLE